MTKAKLKVIEAPERKDSAVAYARELLDLCESGEVVSITILEEFRDGTYHIAGSSLGNRWLTAGRLLDAAMTRLLNEKGADD